MNSSTQTVIRKHVVVGTDPARAFEIFTSRFDAIKPRDHNLLATPIVETVLQPHVGGTIYDRAEDGSVCTWARILVFDPPHRIVFTWDIGPTWQLEAHHANTSEVEIRFTPDGPHRTNVDLEHRHIDRHGPGWENVHTGVDNPNGWDLYLHRYAQLTTS